LTCSDSAKFICNICGAQCPRSPGPLTRDAASCSHCGSSVRVRALVALLAREVFGIELTLPEFPVMKGIRGIGMSDSTELASRLAEKFDYTNTFYHQAPFFDVTGPQPQDEGRYDFILSSEVMEHIPPPVERGFEALCRLLQPNGLLLITTPYTIGGKTIEHFPDLHEYALASPGGHAVLVNRRKDGTLETFDNLVFHGGPGSTLEMRVFAEQSLRELFAQAGFREIHIATENSLDAGIQHGEPWSLPIAARKEKFAAPPVELAREYLEACRRADRKERDLAKLQGEYEDFLRFHDVTHEESKRELARRAEWAQTMENNFEERTRWALSLEFESKQAHAALEKARESERAAWDAAKALEQELVEARSARVRLERRIWTRLGRKLGAVD
jgi:SAM-dependent methyltransferase